MVSKNDLKAIAFVALVAILVIFSIVEWLQWKNAEETIKSMNGTKMVVMRTNEAYAMLSHMKIINSTNGLCTKIYATDTKIDVVVLICGARAYVFYLD
jgi:hypothetical protein